MPHIVSTSCERPLRAAIYHNTTDGVRPSTRSRCPGMARERTLLEREHVDRAAFGDGRHLTGEEAGDLAGHAPRVAAPSREHGQVLLTVDRKRRRRREHPGR